MVILLDLNLAIVAAYLAVVGLGIQLGVHDVFIDELHHFQNGIDVVLHIGHFYIADGSAGGQLLELRLEAQLGKGIDVLGHMDMVGVCNVALVRNAGDHAETLLQALGELIGGGFQRGAIEGEIDVLLLLPAGAGIVHILHDLQSKGLGGLVGVGLSGHVLDALVKTGVAQGDGGIAAVEQLIDGLPLLESGQRSVLPQDGRGIGQCALQPVVTAHQRPVAEVQPLIEYLPELVHILSGGQGYIHQIHGDHALVEAAIVLGLSRFVVLGPGDVVPAVTGPVRRQEAAAAHAGVHIALARSLSLGELVLPHLLFADIVGNHPLGGALGGQLGQVPVRCPLPDVFLLQHIDQLGEGRGDPHALFVLHALVALAQGLLNDHGQVLLLLLVPGLVQVHEDRDKRSLSIGCHQGHHLVLDGLHTPADLVPEPLFHHLGDGFLAGSHTEGLHFLLHTPADLLPADLDEGGQMGQRDGLAAILVGGHLGDDLSSDVAGSGEGMGLLNERTGNHGAVLQHIVQVDQIAVVHMLGIVIGIVEMDDAGLVCRHNVPGQQDPAGNVLGNLACHIVPLDGVDGGVFVGILLLDLLVVALDQAQDPVIRGVGLAQEIPGIAVGNIFLGNLKGTVAHDGLLHQILDLFHGGAAAHLFTGHLYAFRDPIDLHRGQPYLFIHLNIGLGNGHNDLRYVKGNFSSVSLNDFHRTSSLLVFLSLPPYYTISCGFVKT